MAVLERKDTIKESHEQKLFYCWECISLKTWDRTYDFQIRDRKDMLCFINAVNRAIELSH